MAGLWALSSEDVNFFAASPNSSVCV
jgi:hypothetical protein